MQILQELGSFKYMPKASIHFKRIQNCYFVLYTILFILNDDILKNPKLLSLSDEICDLASYDKTNSVVFISS